MSITTDYETSKRLWDAGVRIDGYLYWMDDGLNLSFEGNDYGLPAPTFTELVEWLKGRGYTWCYDELTGFFIRKIGTDWEYIDSPNPDITAAAAECCLEVAKREGGKNE